MASLDKMEGEAIDGVILAALIAVVVIIFLAYSKMKGLDPSEWWQKFLEWLKQLFDGVVNLFHRDGGPVPGASGNDLDGPSGGAQVYTGTDTGTYSGSDDSGSDASSYGPYAPDPYAPEGGS